MVQPLSICTDPAPDNTPLYPIGCAGRIVSFEETETGHLFIALRGLCRFDIKSELPLEKGYRQANVDYSAFTCDIREDEGSIPDRARLIGAVRRFFKLKDIDVDWQAIEESSDETLITSLAMISPLAASEKQALLEATGLSERGELISSFMEMALLEDADETGSYRH
jgi:Lon protease-like protein